MTLDRRGFLAACSRAGITSALMPGVLYTLAMQTQEAAGQATGTDQSKPPVFTPEMIDKAAELAGVGPFSEEQKKMMIDGLTDMNGSMKAIRKLNLPNSLPPAFVFHPMAPAMGRQTKDAEAPPRAEGEFLVYADAVVPAAAAPARVEDVSFATVHELASLVKARRYHHST